MSEEWVKLVDGKPPTERQLETEVEAEWGCGFQEYEYENGTRVPEGAPVGFDNEKTGEFQAYDGVYWGSEPHPCEGCSECE